jgi:S1-C subfamily serine protease
VTPDAKRPHAHRVFLVAGIASALVCVQAVATTAAQAPPSTSNKAVIAALGDVETNLAYQNAAAAGTGMVLTSNGELLTNNHVIRGATTIKVRDVGNGRTYTAVVLGYDIGADVALLRMQKAAKLKTVPLGNSTTARVGARVTVLGNAGGKGGIPVSTSGTVLALHRTITAMDESSGTSEQLVDLIETSAAVQPGDSGGALINATSRVIGLVTAGSASYELQPGGAVSFAVPINKALAIAHSIEAKRFSAAVHPGATAFLGVGSVASDYVQGTNLVPGALVVSVVPGSPAEKAGVVAGDVITGFAGITVSSPTSLVNALLAKAPGATVSLSWVDQFANVHTAQVTLANGPPQ